MAERGILVSYETVRRWVNHFGPKCHRSRVPVLAIAAQIPSAEIGAGYFQETHPETLFRECSHYCELISGANQMPRTLEVAIRQAVGNRGVSVVVMPGDVALQPASDAPAPNVSGLPGGRDARACGSRPAGSTFERRGPRDCIVRLGMSSDWPPGLPFSSVSRGATLPAMMR